MGDRALWLWLCVCSTVLVGGWAVLVWCAVCWDVCCLCGSVGSGRAVACGYLGRHGPGWRSLRVRGVWHVVVGWRGG
eukprot:scaffold84526_cov32-Tisochrysis_lutea.AAC.1